MAINREHRVVQKKTYRKDPIPLVLIIDSSESMKDLKNELNECISKFIDRIKKSVTLQKRTYLLVLKYNDTVLDPVFDFEPIETISAREIFLSEEEFAGTTNTGLALLRAYEKLEKWYASWEKKAVNPKMCLTFLLTDGALDAGEDASLSDEQEYEANYARAAEITKKWELIELLFFVAGAIQNGTLEEHEECMNKLRELSDNNERILSMKMGNEEQNKNTLDEFFNTIHECTKMLAYNSTSQEIDEIFKQK